MKIAVRSNKKKNPNKTITRVNFHNFVFNWGFNSLSAEFSWDRITYSLSPKDKLMSWASCSTCQNCKELGRCSQIHFYYIS